MAELKDHTLDGLQVQLLEFNPEIEAINVLASYLHGQEIWHLAPHPTQEQTLATISNQGKYDVSRCHSAQYSHTNHECHDMTRLCRWLAHGYSLGHHS